ncbi:hypothetical protein CPB84DRAFT_481471 [Gymnopilus junonius]|uniref:Copper-fist domain-containing protein n=1 Tax=Gymnopilus junonius TaxID=109634 RepID=A0A9P5NXM2_GYMJU|nr:hypothetical protein CPB84DRAFT_481471 [Gymnopilus junonius]
MVYVNSKKFACESCIKGHRSSSCHHADRPLFEIKKKGRPVSQCTKCRELRQSKKFHSKCTCNHPKESTPAVQPLASSSTSKTRRFIPIVPALPNGLRDVLSASSLTALPSDSRQRGVFCVLLARCAVPNCLLVDALLNPCDCKSVRTCTCNNSAPSANEHLPEKSSGALFTLAHAAAMFSASPFPAKETIHTNRVAYSREKSDCTSLRPASPTHTSRKHHKHHSRHSKTPGPALPPILYNPFSSQPPPTPNFPSMPPMSEITSLAGTGCTCGLQCSCPGCVEHRGRQHINHERRDCADGCGTCIDPTIGMALPNPTGSSTSGTSVLDIFFARAAALPPPPSHRKMSSYDLDPMDTSSYADPTRASGSKSFAFRAVNLPKLECCGGECSCPNGECSCRVSCAGCCLNNAETTAVEPIPLASNNTPLRSCCSREA